MPNETVTITANTQPLTDALQALANTAQQVLDAIRTWVEDLAASIQRLGQRLATTFAPRWAVETKGVTEADIRNVTTDGWLITVHLHNWRHITSSIGDVLRWATQKVADADA